MAKKISKSESKKAERLLEIVTLKKNLQEEEMELKAHFKEKIVEGELVVGSVRIIVKERVRTNLDRQALKRELGKEYKRFLLKSSYQELTVKRTKGAA